MVRFAFCRGPRLLQRLIEFAAPVKVHLLGSCTGADFNGGVWRHSKYRGSFAGVRVFPSGEYGQRSTGIE